MVVCARMPGKITLLVDSRINKFVPFVKRAACPFDAYNDITTIVMERLDKNVEHRIITHDRPKNKDKEREKGRRCN